MNAPKEPTKSIDQVECYPCGTPKRKPQPTAETSASANPVTNTVTLPFVDRITTAEKSATAYPCGGAFRAQYRNEEKSLESADKPVGPTPDKRAAAFDRRTLMISGGGILGAAAAYGLWHESQALRANVFIAKNQRYDGPLAKTIRDGLLAVGFEPERIRGKRVLLKPNLVEPSLLSPQMTTNPMIVLAAAEVFLGWGASVRVGEGPGHVRDTENALYEGRMLEALDDARLTFVDLNYEETAWVGNQGNTSKLPGFHFPRSVVEADLLVSLPKLKTHHWVGFTSAMKNLYGVIPGIRYGWPKNVLHYNGIPQTILDINASLPKTIGIIDAIECMEGDGPILGSPKQMGLVMVGLNPTALDATAARIMGLVPERVSYLELAAQRLGPIAARHIEQRGEAWRPLVSPFAILDEPHLRSLKIKPGELVT